MICGQESASWADLVDQVKGQGLFVYGDPPQVALDGAQYRFVNDQLLQRDRFSEV
jgi:hypothetical protein